MRTLIEKAKKDILQFKKDNPKVEINSFYELHDYFDANDYIKSLVNDSLLEEEEDRSNRFP